MEPSPSEQFLNRELQWLEFNRRVLFQAEDPSLPLLERLKFLGIFSSNLDEFVMKRVGGLKRQVDYGLAKTSHDGLSAADQLIKIRQYLVEDYERIARTYKNKILPELADHQIQIKKWKQLDKKQKNQMREYYINNIFPVLTPLVVDNALPFPFISNLSLSLAIKLENKNNQEILFGRVKIPPIFPSWLEVTSEQGGVSYVSLLQVIAQNLGDLFPDMHILKVMPFRVTRNADLDRDEEGAEDLLEMITEEVRQRRFAEVVRLEVSRNSDPWMLELLQEELEVGEEDTYLTSGLLDYSSLIDLTQLPFAHLKFPPWDPQVPTVFQDVQTPIFDLIKKNDILVHHPYESFSASVERFIREASSDAKVLAIKMTLYRTNEKSAIISSLIEAAEKGKQVVCLVELKARFDEERNIFWAQQMEKAGIHVVYGVIGFKTHCKTALVLRQEQKEIVAYAHIGTGNYNSSTARLYTDVGLLTANKIITQDVVQLFHFLTGRSFQREFSSLLVAPMNMKNRFMELMDNEIKMAQKGRSARILIKCNSLDDHDICLKLYQASSSGVQVDLLVRGFCCLRPQVKGLSDNIRVVSVVGRFLEHSRIFYFQSGEVDPVNGQVYIGSADWMRRNLHSRVEVVTPIEDRGIRRRLLEILELGLEDGVTGWELQPEGHYQKRNVGDLGSQEELMQLTLMRSQTSN
jgi:polyphosphate kinase